MWVASATNSRWSTSATRGQTDRSPSLFFRHSLVQLTPERSNAHGPSPVALSAAVRATSLAVGTLAVVDNRDTKRGAR